METMQEQLDITNNMLNDAHKEIEHLRTENAQYLAKSDFSRKIAEGYRDDCAARNQELHQLRTELDRVKAERDEWHGKFKGKCRVELQLREAFELGKQICQDYIDAGTALQANAEYILQALKHATEKATPDTQGGE